MSVPFNSDENNNMLKILVVIPVFNRAGFITKTLDSVAAQTHPPSVVVVVDDGSTDNTTIVVSEWIRANAQLNTHLVTTSNRGASAARNLGVKEAGEDMEYVAFLDSDDIWPRDFLERGSSALNTDVTAIAASTDREFHYIGSTEIRQSSLEGISENPWLWMIKNDAGIGSGTLFRMSSFNSAGGYPEDIPTGHDCALFGSIATYGLWLHLTGSPTIFLRSLNSNLGGHHLHSHFPDHQTWWAYALHKCWLSAPEEVQRNEEGHKYLAKRWWAAAKNAMHRKQYKEAKYCLNRVNSIKRWNLKYRLGWVRLYYSRIINAVRH